MAISDYQRQQAMNQLYGQNALGGFHQTTLTASCFPGTAGGYDGSATQPRNKQKGKGMFSEIASDIKTFILEHRYIIYFIALALIVDHLIFKDVFRQRLQAVVEGIIKKVEAKVNA